MNKQKFKPTFKPTTIQQALGYVVEECGEVQQAIGKCFRFGLYNNYDNGELNIEAVKREIIDLENALSIVKEYLGEITNG